MSKLTDFYSLQVQRLSSDIALLRRKNKWFVTFELLTFCLAIIAFILYCGWWRESMAMILTVLFLILYVVVRRFDVKNGKEIDNRKRLLIVYEKELKYHEGDFSVFNRGDMYIDPEHAFTFDMDIFGRDSLFNRICRTVTTGGKTRLAHCLCNLLTNKDEIRRRREAVDELAEMEEWRNGFLATGQCLAPDGSNKDENIDTSGILDVIKEVNAMRIAPFAMHPLSLVVAYILLAGFYITVLLSLFTSLPSGVPVVWAIILLFLVLSVMSRQLRDISRAVGRLHTQLNLYIGLVRCIDKADFKCEELMEIRRNLLGDNDNALASFVRLSDILERLDSRSNILGLIILNILTLSDFFLVRRFLRWQGSYLNSITLWTDCVSRIDALVSMATFRYNEPLATEAEVTDDDEKVVFDAKGLYHPFLGVKAVRNDFTLCDCNYYIVTGANMAGKSTFLRSLGINYILAMNGMPVFADSLKVSVFNLFTSMRTTDDLSRGISYFNAELLRLRCLLDSCKQSDRTLIILDEILKGTNSLDKLNGSRLFLREISRFPVTGVIATHDLELSKMEDEMPDRFHNWCFEIELGNDIIYTYKITRGVARNQNATFLLNKIVNDNGKIVNKHAF
ncbi:MAG: DNA mismatch repair protein MutS [Prevotella sp.]|nr:DNA mismatch repair protein MutS [Prevotella sp.]